MIGDMRERVEILKPQRIVDGGGGWQVGYASLGSVSAQVESRPAGTDRSLGKALRRQRKRFTIRRRDDLVFEMQLIHRGQRFRITDIREHGRKGTYTLLDVEEAPA